MFPLTLLPSTCSLLNYNWFLSKTRYICYLIRFFWLIKELTRFCSEFLPHFRLKVFVMKQNWVSLGMFSDYFEMLWINMNRNWLFCSRKVLLFIVCDVLRLHYHNRNNIKKGVSALESCLSELSMFLFVFAQVLNTTTTSVGHFLPLYLPVIPHRTVLSEDGTAQAWNTALSWVSLPPLAFFLRLFSPSCLFSSSPSPLFLFFSSNKNNRLWNAFSCSITHRHQPPHAIRLRRGGERSQAAAAAANSMSAI